MEATNWYFHKRKVSEVDLDDLKAFILFTAVKNLRKDVVAKLVQRTKVKRNTVSEDPERSAPFVAFSLASLHLKDDLNQRILTGLEDKHRTIYEDNHLRRRGMSLLTWAIQCGHHSLIKHLAKQMSIQRNEDARAIVYDEMTPVELAILCGHEAIARTLIMNGADIQGRGVLGMTALHQASQMGRVEVVRILLHHGANIDTGDFEERRTPLHIAARFRQAKVMQVLIENGANIDAEDILRKTPIMYAVLKDHEPAVLLLLEKGANINTGDLIGRTPLHIAALFGQAKVMQVLIENGANIEAEDIDGKTPIMYAVLNGREPAVLLLLEKGANLLASDKRGKDTRHWVLDACRWKDSRESNDLVTTVFEKACRIMHASQPCPPLTSTRRAVIILESTVSSFALSLYSHHAFIELPPGASAGVKEFHKRTLVVKAAMKENDYRGKFEFSIIHQEDSLEFAVTSAYSPGSGMGSVKLRVINGGTRFVSFDGVPGVLFKKWLGVELDPDAEFVDAVVPGHTEIPTPSRTIEEAKVMNFPSGTGHILVPD